MGDGAPLGMQESPHTPGNPPDEEVSAHVGEN